MWLRLKFEALFSSTSTTQPYWSSGWVHIWGDTSLDTVIIIAPVQWESSPTTFAALYHPPTSRGHLLWAIFLWANKPRTTAYTQQIQCKHCKQFGHLISACRKWEKSYDLSVPRSSVVASAPASVLQSSIAFLSFLPLSQIASYLIHILGITGASWTSDFAAMSAASDVSTPWIFDTGATRHMTFDHSVLTNCSSVHLLQSFSLVTLLSLLIRRVDSP